MLNYKELKKLGEENKQSIVIGVCFILVFMMGFGTGRFNKSPAAGHAAPSGQNNYTTKPATKTNPEAGDAGAVKPAVVEKPAQVLGAGTDAACPVKGNASSRIYHVVGGAYYKTLKSPKCFNTEAEARAAGYRKSGR